MWIKTGPELISTYIKDPYWLYMLAPQGLCATSVECPILKAKAVIVYIYCPQLWVRSKMNDVVPSFQENDWYTLQSKDLWAQQLTTLLSVVSSQEATILHSFGFCNNCCDFLMHQNVAATEGEQDENIVGDTKKRTYVCQIHDVMFQNKSQKFDSEQSVLYRSEKKGNKKHNDLRLPWITPHSTQLTNFLTWFALQSDCRETPRSVR